VHVFVAVHGCVQVEILDVGGHEFCTGCGDDTVEETLGCGEVCGFGADIAFVVNTVAADSEADTTLVGFVGFVGSYDLQVGGLAETGMKWMVSVPLSMCGRLP
jgi:hypothetical protein